MSQAQAKEFIYKQAWEHSLKDKKVEIRLNLSLLWNWYGLEKKNL